MYFYALIKKMLPKMFNYSFATENCICNGGKRKYLWL